MALVPSDAFHLKPKLTKLSLLKHLTTKSPSTEKPSTEKPSTTEEPSTEEPSTEASTESSSEGEAEAKLQALNFNQPQVIYYQLVPTPYYNTKTASPSGYVYAAPSTNGPVRYVQTPQVPTYYARAPVNYGYTPQVQAFYNSRPVSYAYSTYVAHP